MNTARHRAPRALVSLALGAAFMLLGVPAARADAIAGAT
jgi:hypothetical protein